MRVQATAKFVGTSARKTGLVAALIRGRRATDARHILFNTNKRATTPVGKVLESAIANAENNHGAKAVVLIVESVLIGPGPTLKRSMPRAKGSASAIRKRSSHITVVVNDGKAAVTLGGANKGGAKGNSTEHGGVGSDTATTEEKASVRRREGELPAAKADAAAKADKKPVKKEEAK
jgi:large subunit ribosomal protein L22